MRTPKEIQEQIQRDVQFIVSAVTAELHDLARLEYFEAWETNGGMGWFFNECVDITNEIMLTDGSQYLKWLDHWKGTEGNNWKSFSEVTGETCFDWYHMYEARRIFKSRYTKDEDTKVEISEHIGYIINSFESDEERLKLVNMAISFANAQRKHKAEAIKMVNDINELKNNTIEYMNKSEEAPTSQCINTNTFDKVKEVIQILKTLDNGNGVDGETMEYILTQVGMSEQMHRQLVMGSDINKTLELVSEKFELK